VTKNGGILHLQPSSFILYLTPIHAVCYSHQRGYSGENSIFMAELLRGRPALRSEWIVSVGLDLLATASLVTVVHEFEGLGTWVHEAYSAMPSRLRRDLHLALRATNYANAVMETVAAAVLGPGAPGHFDIDALFRDLEALDVATCEQIVHTALARSLERHNIVIDVPLTGLIADDALLHTTLQRLGPPVDVPDAIQLLRDPTHWRDRLLGALRGFWEQLYAVQWAGTVDQLQRSVDHHRRQQYPVDFGGLFTAVTGRQVPERVQGHVGEIEHVRFVPSLYFGPYVAVLFDGPRATIFYNGEGTPATAANNTQIEELYHPLAALADKTRLAIMAMLDGTELYAQEIVVRLGISQSAVSRHLQLMVDMKVLNVRRGERGAKFYSINVPELERVAQRLAQFH
jgi:DNA-binding transcriptional ArsR family regulator